MSKLTITTTKNDNFTDALGISEERFEEIMTKLQEIGTGEGKEELQLTEAAAKVSEELDLNANEVLLLGFKMGQTAMMARQNQMLDLLAALGGEGPVA